MTHISRIRIIVLILAGGGSLQAQQTIAPKATPILETPIGPAFPCVSIDASVLVPLKATRVQCPLELIGGAAFYTDQIRGDNLVVAFNQEGAMIAAHDPSAKATGAFTGTVDHIGQKDDVIHWGLWHTGTVEAIPGRRRFAVEEDKAVPYIVGVSSGFGRQLHAPPASPDSLPAEGIAHYTLPGDAGVVSKKDMRGNVVPIGKVLSAQATVDFKNRTGQLDLSIVVRGTTETIQMSLTPQNNILGFDSGATGKGEPCHRPAPDTFCPAAEAQFFGRDGQFLGLTFSYGHNAVLPEATSVAAYLNNVFAQGAIALQKVQASDSR